MSEDRVDVQYTVTLNLREEDIPSTEAVALAVYRGVDSVDSEDAVYVESDDRRTA